MSEDPIGFQIAGEKPSPPASLMFPTQLPKTFQDSEFNLFRYCHNDPINKTDPMGLYRLDDMGVLQPETTKEFIEMGNFIERGNTLDTTPAIDPISILSGAIVARTALNTTRAISAVRTSTENVVRAAPTLARNAPFTKLEREAILDVFTKSTDTLSRSAQLRNILSDALYARGHSPQEIVALMKKPDLSALALKLMRRK